MYTVHLTYFKPTGKYYSEASVMSAGPELFDIWDDVRTWMRTQCLPGLMAGHSEFIVLVEVPDHPNAHPHLMLPDGDAWEPEIKPAPPKPAISTVRR